MSRGSTARAARPTSGRQPANVPGAKRTHPHVRAVKNPTPPGLYEIVHGTVILENPEYAKFRAEGGKREDWEGAVQVAYYPGEVLRLEGDEADRLAMLGVVVPLGEELVLVTTMPDRERGYHDTVTTDDKGNAKAKPEKDRETEGPVTRFVRLDIETAAQAMYDADSSRRLGGLNGSGR